MGKTHATTATPRRGLYVPRKDPPPVLRAGAESFLRESNNKRNHADTQAMVISSAAGELTLGARPPALLLAPDKAVTAGELLAVALDDEPEDPEADAHEPEADAEGQLTRRAADDHCLGVGVVALVVAFTQETFSASPENRRRIFPRNVQPASWGGGGCIYLFIVTSTIIRHLTTTNTNICKTPHAPPG